MSKYNIVYRIKHKYNYLSDIRFVKHEQNELFNLLNKNVEKKRIFYFSVPSHSNLGDQAQVLCWLKLFKKWYPEYNVIPILCESLTDINFDLIRNKISNEDKIFIHSGYLIFDPHPHLPYIRKIVDSFHDLPITILPQTINLNDPKVIEQTINSFNSHPNLTIISRDEVSKANADSMFSDCRRLLMPDVVTSLIGNNEYAFPNSKRNGIMFCVRNDGEKLYSDEEISGFISRFSGIQTDMCDTSIDKNMSVWKNQREKLIRSMLERFSRYQLIITDRYHGTIFSQIVNTPVIVLSSTDHKLSSGVKWFPQELFYKNISFAPNLEIAYKKANEILKRGGQVIENPPYFMENYYSKPI